MSKINVNGEILDDEAQKKVYAGIKNYIQLMKEKATYDIKLKECIADVVEQTKVDKVLFKKAATDMYKAETGKLDLVVQNDKEAAIEQLREIYDEHDGRA